MSATVLSIDPSGDPRGHTGISLLAYDDAGVRELASWAIEGGIDGFRNWYDEWAHSENFLAVPGFVGWEFIDTVVVEQFINRGIPGADISPLGMQYVVQWLWPDAVLSPASGKNTAVSNTVLKRLGLYEDNSHHHDVREARRHGLRWIKNQGHVPTLRQGWQTQHTNEGVATWHM